MLSATLSRGEGCQPAPSSTRGQCALSETHWRIGQVFVHRLDIDLRHDPAAPGLRTSRTGRGTAAIPSPLLIVWSARRDRRRQARPGRQSTRCIALPNWETFDHATIAANATARCSPRQVGKPRRRCARPSDPPDWSQEARCHESASAWPKLLAPPGPSPGLPVITEPPEDADRCLVLAVRRGSARDAPPAGLPGRSWIASPPSV
jgi:hypothetical protein